MTGIGIKLQDTGTTLLPITMEITFTIKKDSLCYDGKAYPRVSSGCMFGGAVSYHGGKQIDKITGESMVYSELWSPCKRKDQDNG